MIKAPFEPEVKLKAKLETLKKTPETEKCVNALLAIFQRIDAISSSSNTENSEWLKK